jgi:hypothetical protein
MTYNDIVHINAWRSFFADASRNTYSIYLHSKAAITRSDISGCIIIPTQPTDWGAFNLVEVQQALFVKAHEDSDNYKFILLSGDSVPLHSFATVYAGLTKNNKGCMHFEQNRSIEREQTVDKTAWPSNVKWEWLKSTQWIVFNREHIELLRQHWSMLTATFSKSYIPDEHLYSVFFNAFGYKTTFSSPIMYCTFKQKSTSCIVEHRAVPKTHHYQDLTSAQLDTIYGTGAMFLRKVCETTDLVYDWSKIRPLIAAPPTLSDKRAVFPINKFFCRKLKSIGV